MISGRDDIGSSTRAVIHRRPITRRITTVNIRARIITVIRYARRGRDLPSALPPAPRPHNPLSTLPRGRRTRAGCLSVVGSCIEIDPVSFSHPVAIGGSIEKISNLLDELGTLSLETSRLTRFCAIFISEVLVYLLDINPRRNILSLLRFRSLISFLSSESYADWRWSKWVKRRFDWDANSINYRDKLRSAFDFLL